MNENSFCVSKRIVYGFFILFLVFIFLFFVNRINKNKQTISSRAAPLAIIGGTDVKPGEFPAVVYIKGINNESESTCTGTLIAPRWVVTASHCIKNEWDKIFVSVGIVNKSELNKNLIEVVKRYRYWPYNPFNDVGLLLLGKDVNGIIFPKLPDFKKDRDIYKKDNSITVIGWGFIGYQPIISPSPPTPIETDRLQKIILSISKDAQDNFLEYRFFSIGAPGVEILAGGDSGGPVFYKKNNDLYLIGINSYIDTTGPDLLNAVANVAKYTKWINGKISKETNIYPTLAPAPFVNDHSYDNSWRFCSSFKTLDDCSFDSDKKCGYQIDCEVCMPWNLSDIDYNDCPNIIEKINSVKLTTTLIPTKKSTPAPTTSNQKK